MANSFSASNLIETSIGGGWGSEKPTDGHSPVAVIRGTDIPKLMQGDYSSVPRRFESDRKLRTRMLQVGDVVLEVAGGSAARGQYTGRTLLVTQEILDNLGPAICASFCKRLVLRRDLVEPSYFFYYMQDLYKSGRVADYDSQSTGISNFQFAAFLENEILELPPIEIQIDIARYLEVLDRKLESNRAISKTLESIAQTLFRSWFVDFDPVRAKMSGEKPAGMDDATAALFPDSMVDSELGEIPDGWEVVGLGDYVDVVKGKSYKSSELEESNTALVTLKSFNRGGGYRRDGLKPYIGSYKPEQVVEPGEVVIAFTDVTQAGDVIGKPAVVEPNPAFDVLVASLDVGIVRPSQDAVSREFLYSVFMTHEFRKHTEAYSTGTTVLHLSKEAVPSFRLCIPPTEVITAFSSVARPAFELRQALVLESRNLALIRDALLPRLISGDLEVPESLLVD